MATEPTDVNVDEYLSSVPNNRRRADGIEVARIMREVTGEEPRMWGPSMIGFGSSEYRYESGHSGTTFQLGFAPRASALVLYGLIPPDDDIALLDGLGQHTRSKACLYVKRLAGIDEAVLRDLIARAWAARGIREL
jgi:hypothetical protein